MSTQFAPLATRAHQPRTVTYLGSGTCRYCTCRDGNACPGGCWWIDEAHTVCSAPECVETYFREVGLMVEETFAAICEPEFVRRRG